MINVILDILRNNPDVFAYNVKEITKDSYELFFIKQQLDMNREALTCEYLVNIYTKKVVDGKELIGNSSFSLSPSDTEEFIKAKVEEQVKYCDFTLMPSYNMPHKADIKPVNDDHGFEGKSIKEAAFVTADALFEADTYMNGYINSTEIFIIDEKVRFFDSAGNEFSYESKHGEVEFVVTYSDGNEEIELYKSFNFQQLDTQAIKEKADNMLQEAANRIKAFKTPVIENAKVLLQGDYVRTYFEHFVRKLNAAMVYQRYSNYSLNDNLDKNKHTGDTMTIKLLPSLKGSTKSCPFDSEGIVLKETKIIDQNIVKSFHGSNAKCQYIGVEPVGSFSNISVTGGTLTETDLKDENYVEIVRFSDFSIDPITGDFGSEIRLAYYYQKGKPKQIITGGSVSGNVYNSLSNARYLKELVQEDTYLGPKGVLLDNVNFNSGK